MIMSPTKSISSEAIKINNQRLFNNEDNNYANASGSVSLNALQSNLNMNNSIFGASSLGLSSNTIANVNSSNAEINNKLDELRKRLNNLKK